MYAKKKKKERRENGFVEEIQDPDSKIHHLQLLLLLLLLLESSKEKTRALREIVGRDPVACEAEEGRAHMISAFTSLHLNRSSLLAGLSETAPPPFALASHTMSTASVDNASENTTIKTVNVRIKGKVQGVFYRNWTVDSAKQLGLKGWVRNHRDGSVEAVFSGNAPIVDKMIQKCYRGPEMAKVSGLDVSPWDGSLSEGFERRPTEW
ncbi:hypothetical protein O6H91_01G117900 [Diphasiastrum complanatum]|uniref:Uncharacterized protein n=1 Tax=Diphasiastrum complanatum TaxID=34168 RepID=A0ACC2EV85_DIPCM|nr:hypothetical protein O6H91_01G117900 [Diphasiastrum complanatum]